MRGYRRSADYERISSRLASSLLALNWFNSETRGTVVIDQGTVRLVVKAILR